MMLRTLVSADGHAECRVPSEVVVDSGEAPSVATRNEQAPWENGTDSCWHAP